MKTHLIERPKAVYSYIRQHLLSKVSEPIIQSPNGQMSSSNSESADILASHFESVYLEETGGPLPQYGGPINFNNMSNIEFNVDDVRKVLKNLKRDSAPGPDKISSRLLLECADCLSYPVHLLTKYSLVSTSLPNIWKISIVTPIFEKGINGKLLQSIDNFLSSRTFQMKVGKVLSIPHQPSSGVPQGSVIGPVLFLVYTADMLFPLDCQTSVYADDTKIFGNLLTESSSLQSDLDKINQCETNPQLTYNVSDNLLKSGNSQVDLGDTVTNDSSGSEHISNIAKNANKSLYLLKKTFTNPTPELATKLYATYVRPTLEFAAPVWSPGS
ncbi:hypothetical protein JTB14_013863 [Gonioctena quinquepunctata]|nr:hypothetical protein JTB14_013863 [Gonioctena quinquepunctata]